MPSKKRSIKKCVKSQQKKLPKSSLLLSSGNSESKQQKLNDTHKEENVSFELDLPIHISAKKINDTPGISTISVPDIMNFQSSPVMILNEKTGELVPNCSGLIESSIEDYDSGIPFINMHLDEKTGLFVEDSDKSLSSPEIQTPDNSFENVKNTTIACNQYINYYHHDANFDAASVGCLNSDWIYLEANDPDIKLMTLLIFRCSNKSIIILILIPIPIRRQSQFRCFLRNQRIGIRDACRLENTSD
ncbi:hypothetical protein KQX54_008285 [Cotesia glomerata]|uniref:Uncharacterized protein n=1 Tax=Cotesia glomerata TaxID=32391 RepID=A0AAV7I3K3_COTGL|nr:hypothetical protein KQX54_008285 [Cotesia glomerata]